MFDPLNLLKLVSDLLVIGSAGQENETNNDLFRLLGSNQLDIKKLISIYADFGYLVMYSIYAFSIYSQILRFLFSNTYFSLH